MKNFLELPQAFISTDENNFGLVIAGGRKPEAAWLKEASINKKIFCADRGIEVALENNLVPELLLGDCDSTDENFYKEAERLGVKILRHPIAKDDTDLQLLLKKLPEANYIFTGIWGGRFDHLYANVFSLLNFKLQIENEIILADEKEIMLLASTKENYSIKLKAKPKAISLLPLSDSCTVSIKNVRWELEDKKLNLLEPYAISNEAMGEEFTFHCSRGSCGLYLVF